MPVPASPRPGEESVDDLVGALAELARDHDYHVGVAESLTSGQIATALGAGPDASTWFRGGVVAYAPEVKFDLLGVTPGPVVTDRCARELAYGALKVLGADAAVAVTGVGGPDPEEGHPPGTVFMTAVVRGEEACERLALEGSPDEVLAATRRRALEALIHLMREQAAVPQL
jgi:nicotinamide-nucleotide amidase